MTLLLTIERYLEKCNRWLLVVLMTLIAALITLQVLFRYILSLPMHSTEEILTFCAVWVYLLGSVNASRKESHINARILEVFCTRPEQVRRIRAIAAAISSAVLVWLTYWSYDFLLYSIKRWKLSTVIHYPMVYMECAMFICMVLMLGYSVAECVRYSIKATVIKEEEAA